MTPLEYCLLPRITYVDVISTSYKTISILKTNPENPTPKPSPSRVFTKEQYNIYFFSTL